MYKDFLLVTKNILSHSGEGAFSLPFLSEGADALDQDIASLYKKNATINSDPFYPLLRRQINHLPKPINIEALGKNLSVIKTIVEECCNRVAIDKAYYNIDLPENFSLFTLPVLFSHDAPLSIEITPRDAQEIEKIMRKNQLLLEAERVVFGQHVFSLESVMDSPLAMHTMLNIGVETILKQREKTFTNGARNLTSNEGADMAFLVGVIASDCSTLLSEDFDEIEDRGSIISQALIDDRDAALCAMQDELTQYFADKLAISKDDITFLSPETYQSSVSQLRAFANIVHLMGESEARRFTAVKFYIAESDGRFCVFASLQLEQGYQEVLLPYQDAIASDLDVAMHYEAFDVYLSDVNAEEPPSVEPETLQKRTVLH